MKSLERLLCLTLPLNGGGGEVKHIHFHVKIIFIFQHVFYFDEVFGESCTNQDVYMKTAHPLIQHIFNG